MQPCRSIGIANRGPVPRAPQSACSQEQQAYMLYAEQVGTPLRQRPCRDVSQDHRPMQQQTGIMLCLPGCLLLACPTTAQHPYSTSIIVQVPELGGISRPACRRSVTAWARSLPRQTGAVLATNLVAACLRNKPSAHGWRWRNMPREAQRPSRALGNETRPTSCWSSAAFAKSAAAVFP